MNIQICYDLYDPLCPKRGLRMALRLAVRENAKDLVLSQPNGPDRIYKRLWLIETLEACKTVGEWFWRDCVFIARQTMKLEGKS